MLGFTFVVVLLDHLPDSPSWDFVAAIVQRLLQLGQIYCSVSVFVDLQAHTKVHTIKNGKKHKLSITTR